MSIEIIDVGTAALKGKDGDKNRAAWIKANSNFIYISEEAARYSNVLFNSVNTRIYNKADKNDILDIDNSKLLVENVTGRYRVSIPPANLNLPTIVTKDQYDYYTVVAKIEPGESYTISSSGTTRHLRIATTASFPFNQVIEIPTLYSYGDETTSTYKVHTFTNTANAQFLFISSSNASSVPVNIQVDIGKVATPYKFDAPKIRRELVTPYIEEMKTYSDAVGSSANGLISEMLKKDEVLKLPEGKLAVKEVTNQYRVSIPPANLNLPNIVTKDQYLYYTVVAQIEPGKTYTISATGTSRHLRVATTETFPLAQTTTIPTLYGFGIDEFSTYKEHTFTNTANAKYLFISSSDNNATPVGIQVDVGAIAKPYAPYLPILKRELVMPYFDEYKASLEAPDDSTPVEFSRIQGHPFGAGSNPTMAFASKPPEPRLLDLYYIKVEPNAVINLKVTGGNRFSLFGMRTETAPANLAAIKAGQGLADIRMDVGIVVDERTRKEYTFRNDGTIKELWWSVSVDIPLNEISVEVTRVKEEEAVTGAYVPQPAPHIVYLKTDPIKFTQTSMVKSGKTRIQSLYEEYDKLITDFPLNVSKRVLGTTKLGVNIMEYKFKPIKFINTGADFSFPALALPVNQTIKIGIVGGMHGDEQSALLAVLNFFDTLYRTPRISKLIHDLRVNIEFVLMPSINPDGYNALSRHNSEGTDTNRQFTAENLANQTVMNPEARALIKFVEDNPDMAFVIDNHNETVARGGADQYYMAYSEQASIDELFIQMAYKLAPAWQDKYPELPQDANKYLAHLRPNEKPTFAKWMTEDKKLGNIILETWRDYQKSSPSNSYTQLDFTMAICIESFTNLIFHVAKQFAINNGLKTLRPYL